MVSLDDRRTDIEFQFHKGAIRTLRDSRVDRHASIFQFHKGAIRTLRERVPICCLPYFNSIKVRLERKHEDASLMGDEPFQFHKGAIRT